MKKILFFLVIGILLLAPAFIFAQSPGAITINPDIPQLQGIANTSPCGWIVNFYGFALFFSGILAFGAIVFGGFMYATSAGNPSRQGTGKSYIQSALLGMLLLVGAYLILNVINPNLTTCSLPTLAPVQVASAPPTTSGGGVFGSVAATDLAKAGVSVKSGVSLDGIQQNTLVDIEQLAGSCQQAQGGSCNLIITSATDGSHAEGKCSHANGYKADIRPNSGLDSFIASQPKLGVRGDGATLYAFNGGTIADERNLPGVSPHWDLSSQCQ